jgi:hypothetical protein
MKAIIRQKFDDYHICEFGGFEGPHIETDLDLLPIKGMRFDLTPKEQEDITQQYLMDDNLDEYVIYNGGSLRENLEEAIMYCCIVDDVMFVYNDNTGERIILIDLIEQENW